MTNDLAAPGEPSAGREVVQLAHDPSHRREGRVFGCCAALLESDRRSAVDIHQDGSFGRAGDQEGDYVAIPEPSRIPGDPPRTARSHHDGPCCPHGALHRDNHPPDAQTTLEGSAQATRRSGSPLEPLSAVWRTRCPSTGGLALRHTAWGRRPTGRYRIAAVRMSRIAVERLGKGRQGTPEPNQHVWSPRSLEVRNHCVVGNVDPFPR